MVEEHFCVNTDVFGPSETKWNVKDLMQQNRECLSEYIAGSWLLPYMQHKTHVSKFFVRKKEKQFTEGDWILFQSNTKCDLKHHKYKNEY